MHEPRLEHGCCSKLDLWSMHAMLAVRQKSEWHDLGSGQPCESCMRLTSLCASLCLAKRTSRSCYV